MADLGGTAKTQGAKEPKRIQYRRPATLTTIAGARPKGEPIVALPLAGKSPPMTPSATEKATRRSKIPNTEPPGWFEPKSILIDGNFAPLSRFPSPSRSLEIDSVGRNAPHMASENDSVTFRGRRGAFFLVRTGKDPHRRGFPGTESVSELAQEGWARCESFSVTGRGESSELRAISRSGLAIGLWSVEGNRQAHDGRPNEGDHHGPQGSLQRNDDHHFP